MVRTLAAIRRKLSPSPDNALAIIMMVMVVVVIKMMNLRDRLLTTMMMMFGVDSNGRRGGGGESRHGVGQINMGGGVGRVEKATIFMVEIMMTMMTMNDVHDDDGPVNRYPIPTMLNDIKNQGASQTFTIRRIQSNVDR